MYQFWRNNRNVIMVAAGMFVVSITVLLFVLNNDSLNRDLKATVMEAGEAHESVHESTPTEPDYDHFEQVSSGPTVVLGMDGLVDYANSAYEEETLYKSEDMQGELFFAYVHPEDLAGLLSSYGKVLSSKEPEIMVGPFRMRNAEGTYQVQMASMQPLVEGDKMIGVSITTRDITESLNYDDVEIEYEVEELEDEDSPDADTASEQVEEVTTPAVESQSIEPVLEPEMVPVAAPLEEETTPLMEQAIEQVEEVPADDAPEAETPDPKNGKDLENKSSQPEKTEKEDKKNDEKKSDDKKIRDTHNNKDKRLVVEKLAWIINKVYRDPNALAFLY